MEWDRRVQYFCLITNAILLLRTYNKLCYFLNDVLGWKTDGNEETGRDDIAIIWIQKERRGKLTEENWRG